MIDNQPFKPPSSGIPGTTNDSRVHSVTGQEQTTGLFLYQPVDKIHHQQTTRLKAQLTPLPDHSINGYAETDYHSKRLTNRRVLAAGNIHSTDPAGRLLTTLQWRRLAELGTRLPFSLLEKKHDISRLPIDQYSVHRDEGIWGKFYGDADHYNSYFDQGVHIALEGMQLGWTACFLIDFSEKWRRVIEEDRKTDRASDFGTRRTLASLPSKSILFTPITQTDKRYGYALSQALKMPESQYFKTVPIDESAPLLGDYSPGWKTYFSTKHPALYRALKVRVVMGEIEQKLIPLTWYIFLDFADWDDCDIYEKDQLQKFLHFEPEHTEFNPSIKYTGLWVHPDDIVVKTCMPHIEQLVQQAMEGNLQAIPRIHWWYVHLAPVLRGPGGVAELMVHALCRFHGVHLPRWRDGLAPSIETLLEPDEKWFCQNYYLMFTDHFHGHQLKQVFNTGNTQRDHRHRHSSSKRP